MKRLIEATVWSGLVIAWRLAMAPTRRSPEREKATTEGVVRAPSELGITTGTPPSRTATQELVVPRSMPIVLAIASFRSCRAAGGGVRERAAPGPRPRR